MAVAGNYRGRLELSGHATKRCHRNREQIDMGLTKYKDAQEAIVAFGAATRPGIDIVDRIKAFTEGPDHHEGYDRPWQMMTEGLLHSILESPDDCGLEIRDFCFRRPILAEWFHGAFAADASFLLDEARDEILRLRGGIEPSRGEAMTDPLIEKVAQAICESKPDRSGFWETTPDARRKGYRTQARAAVAAVLKGIREPSDQAIADGVNFLIDADLDGPDGVGHSDVVGCWQAMVDALRAELKEPGA